MSKEEGKKKNKLEFDGQVREALPNTLFRVDLDDGREVLAKLAGKMRIYHIKVIPGDKVKVEMTPYDDKKGRITYRY